MCVVHGRSQGGQGKAYSVNKKNKKWKETLNGEIKNEKSTKN